MTSKIEWLTNKDKWTNIKSIDIVKREYEKDSKKVEGIRCYITNLSSTEIKNFKNTVRW